MTIDVLIPAYNAQSTIARAISSALAQPEVASVIVVDDCSADQTAETATAAAAGDPRLRVIRFERNRGPAAARNHALSLGEAPLVALLDADDWMLPGRFARLMALPDTWDLVADNILFRPAALEWSPLPTALLDSLPAASRPLGLTEFVDRNISRPGKSRSELGFLKPVMRREMLAAMALRYAENVRLGEDFVLYAKAMAKGARFQLSLQCGYVAIEHPTSLSGRHSIDDLEAFLAASQTVAREHELATGEQRVFRRHCASIERKIRHRRFLEDKRIRGLLPTIAPLIAAPAALWGIAVDVARDKRQSRAPTPQAAERLLFDQAGFGFVNAADLA